MNTKSARVPRPSPPTLTLNDKERQHLEKLTRASKTPQQLAFRARIILTLAQGHTVTTAATHLETSRLTIRSWRDRWLHTSKDQDIVTRLADAERSGAPATFTPEQWVKITALACTPPSDSARPITHWTPRELAEEAIKQGIVTTISQRHVGRFLKGSGPQTAQKSVLAQQRT